MSEGTAVGGAPDEPGSDEFRRSLVAARNGDQSELGRLLEGYRKFLLAVANSELPDAVRAKMGASDCVQEAIQRAVQNFGSFEESSRGQFQAWLNTIQKNVIADARRRYLAGHKRQVDREREGSFDVADAGQVSPSGQAIAREKEEALHAAMSRLPLDYREVLTLRRIEELSWQEVGERMGRSSEAARKLFASAVLALGQELRKDGIRSNS